MDYRHPIQQIANKWMAEYRDVHFDAVDLEALTRYVNSAIEEIRERGFSVMADNSLYPIIGVSMVMSDNKITVEYIFE